MSSRKYIIAATEIMLLAMSLIMPANAEDNVTATAREIFRHDPSVATIQTNSGHNANHVYFSCDGKYIFGYNKSELTVRERNTLRVIKSFPMKGISGIIPDIINSDIIILEISTSTYPTNTRSVILQPSLVVDWKTGEIIGHMDAMAPIKKLTSVDEPMLYTDNYGYVAARNIRDFAGNGYRYYGQGTVDVNNNDSLMVVSSMNSLVWDLKKGRTVSFLPLEEWVAKSYPSSYNVNTLSYMMPKPKIMRHKSQEAIYNRNIFPARFTPDNTIISAGPTPTLTEWDIDGTLVKSLPLALDEGLIYDFSAYNGNFITATSDGLYIIRKDGTSNHLDNICPIHPNVTSNRGGLANIVSSPFGDGYFISSLCGAPVIRGKRDSIPFISMGRFSDGSVVKSTDNNDWGEILDVKIFDNGRKALATNNLSLNVFNLENPDSLSSDQVIRRPLFDEFFDSVEILPDGRYVVGTSHGNLKIYDPHTEKWSIAYKSHQNRVRSLTLTHDKTKLISADAGNCTVVWDASTMMPIVSILNFWPFGVLTYTPDGYYSYESIGSGINSFAHIAKDNRTYSISQFDITLNRPDIIARRLGAEDAYVAKLTKAWEKRVRKLGFDADKLIAGYHTPEIKIINSNIIPVSTSDQSVAVKVKVSDTKYPVKSITATINGVPVFTEKGLTVEGHKPQTEKTVDIKIPLKDGSNLVQLIAVNEQGAKSLSEEFTVTRKPASAVRKTLWIVAAGVSEYDNPDFRLQYAAKDALDFSTLLKTSVNTFDDIKVMTFADKDFVKASVGKIDTFLSEAKIDDTIVLFFAGHGVLDDQLDYYLAPSDMNFADPKQRGIPTSELTDIFEKSSALQRYVIIDACHSGTIDKDAYLADNNTQAGVKASKIRFRSVGAIRERSKEAIEVSRMASDIFEELNTAAGATFISSASGSELASESSDWNNGLFTKALKDALNSASPDGKPRAQAGKKGGLTLEDVFHHAQKEVKEISNGSQNPRMVSSNSDKLQIRK